MSKTYEKADDDHEVIERSRRLVEKYHRDLENAQVKIDFVFASASQGNAVMLHGYPCLAVVRIVNLKDRAKGNGDAEITIDQTAYNGMTEAQRDGLLDHELYHLVERRDDDGFVKMDDLSRPVLKMKKHDWQMGWFEEVARRHKENSPEVYQAKILWDNAGQAFFPMLLETSKPVGKAAVNPVQEFADQMQADVDAGKVKSISISGGGVAATFTKGKPVRISKQKGGNDAA